MRRDRPLPANHRVRALVASALLLVSVIVGCSTGTGGATSVPTAAPEPVAATLAPLDAGGIAEVPPSEWVGGTIDLAALPPEALETLELIDEGGPYPYRQDGSTFQNREGILPDRPRGFYREFTVDTPGSSDRGARRLVVGDDLAAFYTDDHYASFWFVEP